jgi:hypothetical protein
MGTEACSESVTPVYGAPAPDAAADSSPQDGSAVALYGAAPAPLKAAPAEESASPPIGES